MTRGNQREIDRARAQARAEKAGKKPSGTKSHAAGVDHAAALAAKIEAKKKLADEGKIKERNVGDKYVAKPKVEAMVNPHTGKRDPKLTEKTLKKAK